MGYIIVLIDITKEAEVDRMKDDFISNVSHELRTPLTPINNAFDIILSGKTGEISEKMANFLKMGKRNVTRLSGIINDLLDLSKIEAGKMEYRFEKANLLEPMNMVVSTFAPMAMEKEITLKIDAKVSDAWSYMDSQKIEQILSNLVSNALKFTNPKGKVTISLSEAKKTSKYWQIIVKDNGIGISEENIAKVFDKFKQIENSLSRKVGGTGLGLPIAKEFVLAHRGSIKVESKEGRGSSFIINIPKYDEYMNFLIELSLFFEKSKSANTNFGILKIRTDNEKSVLGFLDKEGKTRISSTVLSDKMGVTASQIRQDFNYFGGFGQQGYGYNVQHLLEEMKKLLGISKGYKVIIVGAGNLGHAIANYAGLKKRGFKLIGIFDNDKTKIGQKAGDIVISDVSDVLTFIKKNKVDIVILTLPKEATEEVADKLADSGIKGFWNFSYTELKSRQSLFVENVHLTDSLMTLSFKINQN